ncbi:MAG: hypothetical protein EXR69_10620 [Myxococcales bacterium]|nr:hypothetical protein [Myxococcales bacterium]
MPTHPNRDAIYSSIVGALPVGPPAETEGRDAFARAALTQSRTANFEALEPAAAAGHLAEVWDFVRAAQTDASTVSVRQDGSGASLLSVMRDQPFIVDTIRKALRAHGATNVRGFHVVVRLVRTGNDVRLGSDGEGRPESVLRFTFDGLDPAWLSAVEDDLRDRLRLAVGLVADFEAMTATIEATADSAFDVSGEDGIETAEFLRWILSDNFVILGISRFAPTGAAPILLGADRTTDSPLWPAAEQAPFEGIVQVRKDSVEVPVHRNGRVDVIRINLPTGQTVIRGLFTHRALTQPCRHLPILRRTLAAVLADSMQRPNSYRYRGLANIFDSLPTEWLFAATTEEIRSVIELVFDAEQDQQARVHIAQRDFGTTFTLISLPERRYSDEVRSRIVALLAEITGATYTDSGLFAGRFDSVLLQIYQTGTRALTAEDKASLQTHVAQLTTPWSERVSEAFGEAFGSHAPVMLARYGEAFPTGYTEGISGAQAVRDIRQLEASRHDGQSSRTTAWLGDVNGSVHLRIYQSKEVLLTDLMPVIDNFGVVITDSSVFAVKPRSLPPQHIDLFRVAHVPGVQTPELLARSARFEDGLAAVFGKHMASDPFNKLLLRANLSWQEVDLVRAYFGYAKQLGLKHLMVRVQDILLNQAGCVTAIVSLFHAKFNPELPGDRAAAIASAQSVVDERLRAIRTNDEDVVLRTLANLVDASLRTNFYRNDRVCHYISFKVDHAKVKSMPVPRLMVEIYVHHREVEGLHLRGGPIARGGLRYSDRADFRTEILGLVTTQMVKNVVIVPEGSKGGFYIKYTIDDPAERRRKGDELYQILIRGMLDVTDNIVTVRDANGVARSEVVHPPRVVHHDGNDPYLVVAADKGTAHLSDTANKLSLAYGFWLGDAFASGGSKGYDHKVIGITARGAWVLVKRNFREMGLDAHVDEFTCMGVGDCGGDVFGNGVIETDKMKLQAAFNHVHIFLDPNPDAARTYVERRRLFDGVLGWDHYNKALISAGGGVYDRKAKTIPLSPEVKAMLGTLEDELPPDQVMTLILKMPVDLFWSGGIGTYVRASWETNADANDPPNDAVRIAAPELRCKCVGEGGNLGFTQNARVEYALNGGRMNTDFVDNSGGVDTSDHEVNLKILLNPMVSSGRITEAQRNDFLRSMTDEVAQYVLEDNNSNGRLISLDVVRSARDPNPYGRAIDWLCNKGSVSRAFLCLPTDDDLRRRAASRQGLVRPEIATVQAHVKMHVYKMLLAETTENITSAIPTFNDIVMNYFPPAVRTTYGADVPGHMLHKAIGMTVLLTTVATDAGSHYFPMMMDLTGASAARAAGAWLHAMKLTGGNELKAALISANARPEGAYYAWTLYTDSLEALVALWLAPGSPGPSAEDPESFAAALAALAANRTAADANSARARVVQHVAKGIPEAVAARIVDASNAAQASEVCAVARARNESIQIAARRYQAIGQASRLLAATRAGGRGESRWDPVARGILRLRYAALLREVVTKVDAGSSLTLGVDRAAEALAAGPLKEIARIVDQVVGETPDVASLLVGEQQIRAVM